MSALTPCNHCTIRSIQLDARKRGATVTLRKVPEGEEMAGWTEILVSDRAEPSYALAVTDHCVC